MSGALAIEGDGQIVIDGLPVADRLVGIQGQVSLKPDLHDECQLGTHLRLTLDVEIVSRTDRKKRSEMGDDEAHRTYGVSILATKKAEIVQPPEPEMKPVDGEEEKPKPEKASGRRARAGKLRPVLDAPEKTE